jgi:hypothetical protein
MSQSLALMSRRLIALWPHESRWEMSWIIRHDRAHLLARVGHRVLPFSSRSTGADQAPPILPRSNFVRARILVRPLGDYFVAGGGQEDRLNIKLECKLRLLRVRRSMVMVPS